MHDVTLLQRQDVSYRIFRHFKSASFSASSLCGCAYAALAIAALKLTYEEGHTNAVQLKLQPENLTTMALKFKF